MRLLQATSPGYARSFAVGSAFSIGWTPCVGPVLGAILGLAATGGGLAEATLLLAVYSLGFSLPFLAMGAFFGTARGFFRRLTPFLDKISLLSGALVIVVGILIFTGSLINLNSFFTFVEVDQVQGGTSISIAGLVIAFAAGIVSVVSPCVLPMVPVYMGYITGSSIGPTGELESARTPFLHALAFVTGFAIIFIILGASVGLAGTVLRGDLFQKVAGALLILLGLQLAGVITVPWLKMERRPIA